MFQRRMRGGVVNQTVMGEGQGVVNTARGILGTVCETVGGVVVETVQYLMKEKKEEVLQEKEAAIEVTRYTNFNFYISRQGSVCSG